MHPELAQNENGTWSLRRLSDASVALGPYQRLIDALYERERIKSGAMPPFGRWVIHGVDEVEPIRFDEESDEEMRSANTMGKTLHLRDWEYEQLVADSALGRTSSTDGAYSDEFETKFHYAVQQRSVAPLMNQSDESRTAPIQQKRIDDDEDAPIATDSRPFYKKHPIIFWTLIGALLTALGNGYKKYQMNERIKAEQTSGR